MPCGVAAATPKAGDGTMEMIRMLKTAKNSAVKARTQALNQVHAIVLTAPAALREKLAGLRTPALIGRCCGLRAGELSSPAAVARHTLHGNQAYRLLSSGFRASMRLRPGGLAASSWRPIIATCSFGRVDGTSPF